MIAGARWGTTRESAPVRPPPSRALVGRADLVRIAARLRDAQLGEEDLEKVACGMGFVVEVPSRSQELPLSVRQIPPIPGKRETPVDEPLSEKVVGPAPITDERRHSMALLRLEEATYKDVPEAEERHEPEPRKGLTPEELSGAGRSLFSPLRMPPLAPWSRLWPLLRDRLQVERVGREPDWRAVLRTLGRGHVLSRIPRMQRRVWTPKLTVWIDWSRRLSPLNEDQAAVCSALERVCGPAAVEVRILEDGDAASPEVERDGRFVRIDPESPILVLGDLGAYRRSPKKDTKGDTPWSRAAKRLVQRGAKVVALVAASRERVGASTFDEWNAIEWERAGLRPRRGFSEERGERARRLLRLCSAAVVVQPGLMRSLRRLLSAAEADISTEIEAWNHEDVAARGVSGMVLKDSARHDYMAGLAGETGLLGPMKRMLDAWHKDLPNDIVHGETIAWSALLPETHPPPGELEKARDFVCRFANSLDRPPAGTSPAHLQRACEVFQTLMPEQAYAHPDKAVQGALRRMRYGGGGVSRPCTVSLVGRSLVLRPAAPNGAWGAHDVGEVGSPISWLPSGSKQFRVLRGAKRVETLYTIQPELRIDVDVKPGEDLVLETDQCRLVFRYWTPESWASAAGRDRFGLWADIKVEGAVYRFRWIPPGQFMMGSPQGGAGRVSGEGPQHRVTFTRGYWMGETPCTQALWEAVMRKNPSQFVSPDRPVEQVSWEDCQEFLSRLGERVSELAPCLPGEAQWEHACRGGTPTATWVGDLEIRGERDAPLLDDIAWYGGNCGVEYDLENGYDTSDWPEKQFPHTKGGTRRVRQKKPNPLGLQDMLGNVYEWCADAWSSYKPEALYDPEPILRGVSRVLRGGSWGSLARHCRAAYRLALDPRFVSDDVGFRLVRGRAPHQESRRQETRKGAEPREGTRSGPDNRDAGRGTVAAPARDAPAPRPQGFDSPPPQRRPPERKG